MEQSVVTFTFILHTKFCWKILKSWSYGGFLWIWFLAGWVVINLQWNMVTSLTSQSSLVNDNGPHEYNCQFCSGKNVQLTLAMPFWSFPTVMLDITGTCLVQQRVNSNVSYPLFVDTNNELKKEKKNKEWYQGDTTFAPVTVALS